MTSITRRRTGIPLGHERDSPGTDITVLCLACLDLSCDKLGSLYLYLKRQDAAYSVRHPVQGLTLVFVVLSSVDGSTRALQVGV